MEKSAADGSSMENRSKRKEILEAKKARYGLINAACSVEDPLASFPGCVHYRRNGLSLHLESGRGEKLSSPLKQSIRSLLKINMEGHYGREWPSEEKVKSREMIAPEARYIFVYDSPYMRSCNETKFSPTRESKRVLVGFAHYRFTLEEDLPVLYVYELQLEPSVQGKGLGKFLMQLLELIAHKNRMGAVVLTVQKANLSAMRFYIDMLRYSISTISPSRVDPQIAIHKNYEILCRAFDHEAKAKLV
ncbi:hypothetical protein Nepgr_024855 [Nepenthes gracilis]|uniref:N-alpha-acetyltransferase 40 n=1 Tax=Nepenthes gracilis TaxID=150966 RepID=A0AAD3T6Q6_NEPGR|nr:hypothetical protein Nepgr_024855 [Nepenthes gracilis]